MKENYGFTLLELIIAITIFSISAVAVYSSFNVGINAWRKAEESYEVRQQARHTLNVMARELRQAINFILRESKTSQNFKDSFEGSADKISFWKALGSSGPGKEKSEGIFKITYYLKKDEDEKVQGNLTKEETRSLYRKVQAYKESLKEEEQQGSESILSTHILDLEFKYAYKEDAEKIWWDKEWKKNPWEETAFGLIPFAVKISLSYPSKNEGEKITFSETVIIPTGRLKQKE